MIRNRGQSTAEVTILIAVIIGALLAMQIYVKRAAMGKLRSAADQVGDQFSPHVTTSKATSHYEVTKEDATKPEGSSTSTIKQPEKQARTAGEEHVEDKLADEHLF